MELTLADRLTIHEILARLDHAVDAQDWDTYLSHFHANAVMDPGFAEPVEGIDAIRGFLEQSEGHTSGKRHVASNVYIDTAGDEPVAHSYLTVMERENIPKVIATATISDTFVRQGDTWVIKSHQVRVDPGMFKAIQDA